MFPKAKVGERAGYMVKDKHRRPDKTRMRIIGTETMLDLKIVDLL